MDESACGDNLWDTSKHSAPIDRNNVNSSTSSVALIMK